VNKHEDRAKDYLLHMLDALDAILSYTSGVDQEGFLANRMLLDAVVRNIGIIGEAAKQLLDVAPEFSNKHPEIPFAEVYGMRNRVIHGYSSVNPSVVWDSVRDDVPELRRQIVEVLENLGGEDNG
jgi:uncharacterized protein with HEPN domain